MHIGDSFPNIRGATQHTNDFDLYQYLPKDKWAVIFAHPGDFTPVCTTELASAAELQTEFKNRNVELVGFSCNTAPSHRKWIRDIEYVSGYRVEFPLFCDPTREHAEKLGILDPTNTGQDRLPLTVRGTFVLKPNRTIALMMVYPHSTGRNMEELLRVLDSLILTDQEQSVATPANWQPGQDVLVAHDVDDEQARKEYGTDNVRTIEVPSEKEEKGLEKHYLRYTSCRSRKVRKSTSTRRNEKDDCRIS